MQHITVGYEGVVRFGRFGKDLGFGSANTRFGRPLEPT
jgi:hypothetical protein